MKGWRAREGNWKGGMDGGMRFFFPSGPSSELCARVLAWRMERKPAYIRQKRGRHKQILSHFVSPQRKPRFVQTAGGI